MNIRYEGPDTRTRGRIGDATLAGVLTVFAVGNLALPESAQEVFNVPYLVLVVAALFLAVIIRLPLLISRRKPWLIPVFLMLSFLPGFLVPQLSGYGLEKAQTFALFAVAMLAACAFRSPRFGIRAVSILVILAAIAMSIALLLFGAAAPNGRVSLGTLNPIGVARLTGLAVATGVALLIGQRRQRVWKVGGLLILVVLGLAATLTTGSRGPLLAAGVSVVAVLLLVLGGRNIRGRQLAGIAILAIVGIWFVFHADIGGVSRILDGGDSGRSGIYKEAIRIAASNPLGIGWGNFVEYGWRWGAVDGRLAPHNVFLEFWVEGGIIALVGLIALFTFATQKLVRTYLSTKEPVALIVVAVLVYAIVNAQVSSDIVGNRLMWVAIALAIATTMLGTDEGQRSRTFARAAGSGL